MTARSEITVTINQPIEKVAQAYATREYWAVSYTHLTLPTIYSV